MIKYFIYLWSIWIFLPKGDARNGWSGNDRKRTGNVSHRYIYQFTADKDFGDRDHEIDYQLTVTRAKLEALGIVTEDLTIKK
jgi:hypothetical protein